MRPAEAESLRGVLQYSSAQVFGGAAALGLKALPTMARAGPSKIDGAVKSTFAFWRKFLREARPRTV